MHTPWAQFLLATLLAFPGAAALAADADNFDDGNDDGWIRFDLTEPLNSFGIPGTYAEYDFPDDGSGGRAFRIRSYAPPLGDAGPGRAFAYRPEVYTIRLFATVDIIGWSSAPDPAFGMLFFGNDVGLGATYGYVFNYNSADHELQFNRVLNEAEAGTIAETPVALDPESDYRYELSVMSPYMFGRVFRLPDTNNPVASVVAYDDLTASGQMGLFNFDRETVVSMERTVVAETVFDNFFATTPAEGALTAIVVDLSPPPDGTTRTAHPAIRVGVVDRDTAVNPDAFSLWVDGEAVPASDFTVASGVVMPNNAEAFPGATLTYVPTQPLSAGSHTVQAVYADMAGTRMTNTWSFTAEFLDNPAAGPGLTRGFNVRVVQGPQGAGLGNSLARAEAQLGPNSPYETLYETNVVATTINYSQLAIEPGFGNNIPGDEPIPGQTLDGGTDNWAMEVTTWLDLPAGVVRLGVQSDDGFRVSTDALPGPNKVLAERNGSANDEFEFYVATAGLYPFRLVWYENTGGAHVEWFSVNDAAERILLNDEGGIPAYSEIAQPQGPVAQGADTVNGPYANETGAVIDEAQRRITLPLPTGGQRFYRLSGPNAAFRIESIQIQANQIVLTYDTP